MAECILILGGAGSGKSSYALSMCKNFKKKIFLATAQPIDEEIKEKIEKHKKERGTDWITVEEPVSVAEKIKSLSQTDTVILLDCLTFWINNLMLKGSEVEKETYALKEAILTSPGTVIVISNEVGLGIVPAEPESRKYRYYLASANKEIAQISKKVIFMIAGIPLFIKSESPSKDSLIL
jgi:adenosylcobinamide kinase/adenosylcobinamide-phosphate guanylyltransferase